MSVRRQHQYRICISQRLHVDCNLASYDFELQVLHADWQRQKYVNKVCLVVNDYMVDISGLFKCQNWTPSGGHIWLCNLTIPGHRNMARCRGQRSWRWPRPRRRLRLDLKLRSHYVTGVIVLISKAATSLRITKDFFVR